MGILVLIVLIWYWCGIIALYIRRRVLPKLNPYVWCIKETRRYWLIIWLFGPSSLIAGIFWLFEELDYLNTKI